MFPATLEIGLRSRDFTAVLRDLFWLATKLEINRLRKLLRGKLSTHFGPSKP